MKQITFLVILEEYIQCCIIDNINFINNLPFVHIAVSEGKSLFSTYSIFPYFNMNKHHFFLRKVKLVGENREVKTFVLVDFY